MGARTASRLAVLAIPLALIALSACSAAGGASRTSCRPADDFSPTLPDTAAIFEAISPDYIDRAFLHREDRPLRLDGPDDSHEVEINALSAPTIVLVLTSQNRLAKLLAHRDGKDLLIRKLVSYPLEAAKASAWQGQPEQRENVRVREGDSANLDPPGGDSLAGRPDIEWKSDGRPPVLVIRPARTGPTTYSAQIKSLIVVPVVAHRMKSRQHADDVKQTFSNRPSAAQRPEDLFTVANDKVDRGINAPWAPAGILFYLQRLEDCEYSLEDFPVQPSTPAPASSRDEVMPWPMGDCQTRFRLVNSAYNAPDVRGLDLYLWSNLEGDVVGYAGRHKDDWPSPGPGAVWIDKKCTRGDQPCARILAHEFGHFLRLCHICVTKTTPPADRGRCGFCLGTAECSNEHLNLLMRDDRRAGEFPGDQAVPILTLSEIKTARKEAWQRVGSKTGGQ